MYIVVAFIGGIGYTYQIDRKYRWPFCNAPRVYCRKMAVIKRAQITFNKIKGVSKVVVYNIDGIETFSCSDFKNWDDRIVYEIGK